MIHYQCRLKVNYVNDMLTSVNEMSIPHLSADRQTPVSSRGIEFRPPRQERDSGCATHVQLAEKSRQRLPIDDLAGGGSNAQRAGRISTCGEPPGKRGRLAEMNYRWCEHSSRWCNQPAGKCEFCKGLPK